MNERIAVIIYNAGQIVFQIKRVKEKQSSKIKDYLQILQKGIILY